jgi:hypothetical protein
MMIEQVRMMIARAFSNSAGSSEHFSRRIAARKHDAASKPFQMAHVPRFCGYRARDRNSLSSAR